MILTMRIWTLLVELEMRKRKKENSDIEEDSDDEALDMDTQENIDEDEPTGLDGEDDDNFKDLSSGDEGEHMDDGDDEFDEEGFGGDDFDEEGFGNEEDDPEDSNVSKVKMKGKKGKAKFPKFDPNDLSSLFADAEEFAHLLDENEDEGLGTSVSNKDKASKKQLNWEDKSDKSMKGSQSWKNNKMGKKGDRGNKNFRKPKPSFKPS